MDKKQLTHFKSLKVVSVLLSLAVFASATALFLYKIASARAYYDQWKDYDDCGLG